MMHKNLSQPEIQNHNNIKQFLRIKSSEQLQQLQQKPRKMLQAILNNRLLYLDFHEPQSIKILQPSDPGDSDQETQCINGHYIAGLSNLSDRSLSMVKYLSQNKVVNQHKRSLDQIVRARIGKLSERRAARELEANRGKRKKLNNYNLNPDTINTYGLNNKGQAQFKIPQNPNKLQQYLQSAYNQKLLKKLKQGEHQLQKSISNARQYKKIERNKSLDMNANRSGDKDADLRLSMNNKQLFLRFPNIRKIRYDARNV